MQIPRPFRRSTLQMAYELYQLAQALGIPIDIHPLQRACRIAAEDGSYFFRIGGACYDMGVGHQRPRIRCDIGPFAGCSIAYD